MWPMLSAKAVTKHFPDSVETAKGHMRQTKSGVRSTKVKLQIPDEVEKAEALVMAL